MLGRVDFHLVDESVSNNSRDCCKVVYYEQGTSVFASSPGKFGQKVQNALMPLCIGFPTCMPGLHIATLSPTNSCGGASSVG